MFMDDDGLEITAAYVVWCIQTHRCIFLLFVYGSPLYS